MIGGRLGDGRVDRAFEPKLGSEPEHLARGIDVGEDVHAYAAPRSSLEGEDRAPDVADRLVDLLHGLRDVARDLGAGDRQRRLRRHSRREQPRDDLVVELAGDALPVLEDGDVLEARLQAGVVDGDAGRGSQRHRQSFVLLAELLRTLLVGEVEAPDGFTAPDGHAEERGHLRVPGWELLCQRVLAQVAQPNRLWIVQEDTENAPELRKAPDGLMGLVLHAARHEIGQLAVVVYDAQGAVSRVDQLASRIDDPLQDRGQAQVRG